MASNFPSSLDSFTNPSSTDAMDSVSVPHATQHSDLNDAVEALEAKVGADGSGVTSSHDYKIAQLEGRDTAGLVHISRTTIGTAVSSVTVSGAFSADYDNYKILISGGASSHDTGIRLQLGSTTTGYRWSFLYTSYASTPLAIGTSTGTLFEYSGACTIDSLQGIIELQSPYLAENTFIQSTSNTATFYSGMQTGTLDDLTSYTAFTLSAATGTMTGGHIDVYGYAKA